MKPAKDIVGKVFGRLTVLERIPRKPENRNAFWRCKCECGNETIAAGANLGKTTFSCGCLAREVASKINTGNTHSTTHNLSRTKEYSSWWNIKQRCHNPKHGSFMNYGGRGISMCKRWFDSLEDFVEDMGRCPPDCNSIDRIDNNKSYEPGNCRWATIAEQANNRRNNVKFEYKGEKLTIMDILKRSGSKVSRSIAFNRIVNSGWSVEDAITIIPISRPRRS